MKAFYPICTALSSATVEKCSQRVVWKVKRKSYGRKTDIQIACQFQAVWLNYATLFTHFMIVKIVGNIHVIFLNCCVKFIRSVEQS